MRAEQIMRKQVFTVTTGQTLSDAAQFMWDHDFGSVPVVDQSHRVVGMITDRDITCRVTASGHNPATTTAKAIMTGDVSCCFEEDPLVKAAEIMEEKRVRRLPVHNQDEVLVALLTADDLAWHTDHTLLGEVIETVYEVHE